MKIILHEDSFLLKDMKIWHYGFLFMQNNKKPIAGSNKKPNERLWYRGAFDQVVYREWSYCFINHIGFNFIRNNKNPKGENNGKKN